MNIKSVVIVFVMLCVSSCAIFTERTDIKCEELVEFTETFSEKINGQERFEVKTVATDVEIVTWDKNEVSIILSGRRPKTLSGKDIEVDIDSDEIELEFQYDDEDAKQKCYREVKAVIKLPKTIKKFEVDTVSGNSKYRIVGNKLEVKSVSGDVEFAGGRSDTVYVKTVSGDVTGKIEADKNVHMTFKSISGDCHLKLSEALAKNIHLYVKSISGDYSVLGFKGSGDFRRPKNSGSVLKFKTISGDLTIE